MKHNTIKIRPISLALLLAGFGLAPAAYAVNLVAIEGQWSPDGGTTQIPMWGFARDTGQACNLLPAWDVGPQLTDTGLVPDVVAGDLTVNLRNCLSEGVSLVIPGKPAATCNPGPCAPTTMTDGANRTRVTAFTTEAAAPTLAVPLGGTVTYTFTGIGDGTYLYQSGSHPAKQVQMGLYGALTIGTYGDAHHEVTLLYSEIDPELHTPTPKAATPLGYHPRHYLVNGETSAEFLTAGDTNHPTLLRFLNAGLDFHVPALNTGYMELVAEDANEYPFPKRQYSANLAAGKTIDALWQAPAEDDYVIYDRRGNGMIASLTVEAGVGQPDAVDDGRNAVEDTVKRIFRFNLYGNDKLADGTNAKPSQNPLVSDVENVVVNAPSSGSLIRVGNSCAPVDIGTACSSTLDYTPNPDFNGQDTFTYKFRALVSDGLPVPTETWTIWSDVATVTMNVAAVNDAPVADANGSYAASVGVPVTLDGTGSSDIDVGDTMTYAWDFGDLSAAGTGATPEHTYAATGTYTVSLVVTDGSLVDSLPATSTVEVTVAVNAPPVAVEDFATVQRNSPATFINLTANDSDPDGNLDVNGITITTGAIATRGGTVSVVTSGVNFTPKRNFRGTDTFNYTVADLDGKVSNEVTVRVNVVK